MIRRIAPADLPQVMQLSDQLHKRAPHYRELPYHRPTLARYFQHAASTASTTVCWVADHDGTITGFLLGVVQEYWWAEPGKGPRVASNLLFYSKRIGDGGKMLDEFIAWARGVPRVRRIEEGVSSGIRPERVRRLYRERGFDDHGSMHILHVDGGTA